MDWRYDSSDRHFRQLTHLQDALRHLCESHFQPPDDLDEFERMHWAELRGSLFRGVVDQLLAELKAEAITVGSRWFGGRQGSPTWGCPQSLRPPEALWLHSPDRRPGSPGLESGRYSWPPNPRRQRS